MWQSRLSSLSKSYSSGFHSFAGGAPEASGGVGRKMPVRVFSSFFSGTATSELGWRNRTSPAALTEYVGLGSKPRRAGVPVWSLLLPASETPSLAGVIARAIFS